MALAPTTGVGLAGGLQDTGVVDATLQYFIPEIWGQSIQDYMEKNLVFGAYVKTCQAWLQVVVI